MRNLPSAVLMLLGLAAGCLAQAVRLAPGISVSEAEYRDAVHAWSQADPDLAKDLLRVPADEMRGRIRRVAALRDDAMVKKRSYLAELVERLQKARNQMTGSAPDRIPADEIKWSLPDEQARTEGQRESVETLLRDLPPGDEYAALRRDLEGEGARLAALHYDLAARSDALDALGRVQEDLDAAQFAGLVSKFEAVVQVWKHERDDIERQRANWRDLYAAMERAVNANANPAGAVPGKTARGKKKKKTDERKGADTGQ
jgi:hypothetical protein